jgi:hypothetical protein
MTKRLLATIGMVMFAACGASDESGNPSVEGMDEATLPVETDPSAETTAEENSVELGAKEAGLTAACFNTTPRQTFTGSVGSFTASGYSSTCGAVFDVNNFSTRFLGPIVSPGTFPTTKAACEALRIQFAVYDKATGRIVRSGSQRGVFQNDPPFVVGCDLSVNAAPGGAVAGKNFRFAVAAFNPSVQTVRARSVALP